MLPNSIQAAIDAFSDLPGIGSRSAERLVFSLLRNQSDLDKNLAKALSELKTNLHECEITGNYCDGECCLIFTDPKRNHSQICVVETPLDLLALERTGQYRGTYQVIHGLLSPLNKVGPEDLAIDKLLKRLEPGHAITEIILALPSSVEGDGTSFYLTEMIEKTGFRGETSRLARGIPSGGDLDYLDTGTLSQALNDRRGF